MYSFCLYVDPKQLEWELSQNLKRHCLSVGYVILPELPCLASVGVEPPSLTDARSAMVEEYPGGPYLLRGEGHGDVGMIVGGGNQEGGSKQDVNK